MWKGDKITKLTGLLLIPLFVGTILFALPGLALAAGADSDQVTKAKFDAEKARADAKKAMAEAEKAIAEAERAIAQAQRVKDQAKKEKEHAMEKMVEAGYFPEDFAMTAPGSTTPAIFSHKKHTQREKLRCIECHPKVFIMKVGKNVVKKGQLTMAEMKKGKYCGNCHNGHKAFSVTDIASCKRCHPQQKQ